jgi:hypothetical protein
LLKFEKNDLFELFNLIFRGYVSDEEEYTLSPIAVMPPPPLPRPFHMRGNSADSTLTESSVLNPYQRPKRPSPRKRPAKSSKSPSKYVLSPSKSASNLLSASKSTTNLKRIELHGSDELQLSEQVREKNGMKDKQRNVLRIDTKETFNE